MAVTLEARDLGFGYRGKPIGRDVSFALRPGEVVCLLGPNGGGKTTLFRTLLGLLPAQAGTVLLDGMALTTLPRREVARRIAYVPQAHSGYFPFTVREIVLMGRTAHLAPFAIPAKRDHEYADRALERVGIARLGDATYTRISGGERQLTLIARALAQDAPLLVMDEPTANLDFGNQVKVLEYVVQLARAGIGVLLSTHDPDHAFLCGDRVATLHQGTLARVGAPNDVLTAAWLESLYGVAVEVKQVSVMGEARTVCLPSLGRLMQRAD